MSSVTPYTGECQSCSITNPRGDTDSEESSSDEIELILDTSKIPTMPEANFNPKDLGRVLAEHNNHLMKPWADQIASLSQTFQQSHVSDAPKYSRVKRSKFLGKTNKNVVEFSTNFGRAADFHKWEESRNTEALPLHLEGNASIWYNTTPSLSGGTDKE